MEPTPSLNPNSRKQASQEHLIAEAIASISDYGIFLLDPSGVVLTWNRGAARITGYTQEEITGQPFTLFYTREDIDRRHAEEELLIARQEGRFEEEGWRVRKDGTRFWAGIVLTALRDASGHLIGFSKVTRDLSERRKSEDALRASEERFRQLVEGVKDYAIFLIDAKGVVATWNEGAMRLKGYTAAEIVGQHFSKFYPAYDIAAGKCEFELEEASITGKYEEEGWRLRKDGTMFWANVVITALRDSAGRVTGFSKVTRDLTERRRAEERLRRANEELERRVGSRTQELSRAKEDLERAIQSRDDFLSIASHELKTPITSLKLQAQMLRNKFKPEQGLVPTPEKTIQTLETVVRQADRLTNLIEYLLDVSRAQLGKFTFQFERTDISALVNEVLVDWVEPLRTAGCRLDTHIEPGIFCQADGYRLEQVLANLLSNAMKYSRGAFVSVSAERAGQEIFLSVKDTGPGIPNDKLGTIFERFERADSEVGVSGFGLGLYISKTIVEAHHGNISVRSRVGAGTTFTVCLPLNVVPASEGAKSH